jgi:hypothetical protein
MGSSELQMAGGKVRVAALAACRLPPFTADDLLRRPFYHKIELYRERPARCSRFTETLNIYTQ